MLNLSRTQSYEAAGAVQWTPPEFYRLGEVKPKRTLSGDVFSFGRVAYAVSKQTIQTRCYTNVHDPVDLYQTYSLRWVANSRGHVPGVQQRAAP
jgi:hypothetical protein